MQFPARFSDLPEYAFPRLRRLLDGVPPGGPELAMTIGEPKHPLPEMVGRDRRRARRRVRALPAERRHARAPRRHRRLARPPLRRRPSTPTTQRHAAQRHPRGPVQRRHRPLARRRKARRPAARPDAEPLLPGLRRRGARRRRRARAGARPPRRPASSPTTPRCRRRSSTGSTLCYLCSPSNPQGAVADAGYLARPDRARRAPRLPHPRRRVLRRDLPRHPAARRPRDRRRRRRRPRAGGDLPLALQALERPRPALRLRRRRPARDRRAAPAPRLRRRAAAAAAPARRRPRSGSDEAHVEASRALYREKFALADRMLGDMPGYAAPQGGFFLWLRVGDGEAAALRLWRETGVRVLPGGYLGRATADGGEPRPGLHPRGAGRRRRRGRARPRRDPRHARARRSPRKRSDRWPRTQESQAPRAADGERHRGARCAAAAPSSIGLVLLGIAALAATMIWTYSPDDPSLFSATDEAPRNALGLVGASLADPLHRALGWAAYGIAAGLRGLGPALHPARRREPRRRAAPSSTPGGAPRRRRLRRHPRAARRLDARLRPRRPPRRRRPRGAPLALALRPRRCRSASSTRRRSPPPSWSAPPTPSASPGPSSAASCASSARARSSSTPAPTA